DREFVARPPGVGGGRPRCRQPDSVVRLASFKLAIEDFQCAASLVQTFKGTPQRSDKPTTEELVQKSASAAPLAYTMFASGFQRWATALARGEGLPLREAEEIKAQNGWAGRSL